MILLGLILIVVAALAGTVLFLAAQPLTEPIELVAFGVRASMLPVALLIAGAAVMLLLWLGLAMVRASLRRGARRRREAKELQRQAEREAAARREAEAHAAASPPVPAQRLSAGTPGGPGADSPTDVPADGSADAREATSDEASGPALTRAERRSAARGEAPTQPPTQTPTVADRVTGHDDRDRER